MRQKAPPAACPPADASIPAFGRVLLHGFVPVKATGSPVAEHTLVSAPADGASGAPALFGNATAPILVLSNETVKPTTAQIASCGALSAVAENPNCIAFKLTPTITPDSATPAAIQGTPALASNEITYTLTNGIYDFKYTSSIAAEGTTFSTHDEMGTYKATLTMTEIAI